MRHFARELLDLTLHDPETPKLVYELVAAYAESILQLAEAQNAAQGPIVPEWGGLQVARHQRDVLLDAARKLEAIIEEAMQ